MQAEYLSHPRPLWTAMAFTLCAVGGGDCEVRAEEPKKVQNKKQGPDPGDARRTEASGTRRQVMEARQESMNHGRG